ncbi:MAG: HesA/MoeB/ThiF family protein, partial [Actinomycetia bacterium]|nr:HesA/MoeB/ThiF family protein [Actinomycetes bacterium]
RLPGFGMDAQAALRAATVLVVGAGGLGAPALAYLAGAGVGELVIADDDVVAVHNLHRQVLYDTSDAGTPKASRAAARLAALNPDVRTTPVTARVTPETVDALVGRATVVLDCTDDVPTRYLLNEACVRQGVPEVWATIGGWSGRCGVSWPGRGPCFACVFGPALSPDAPAGGPPVFGPVCGATGALQAAEAVKVLTGVGEPLVGRMACLDVRTGELVAIPVRRDPACPVCGAR